MTNNITNRKIDTLHKIYKNYQEYKGKSKSKLEKELENLKQKLTEKEYNNLMTAFNSYKNYLINIFAYTAKVRVIFDEEQDNLLELEDLETFEDL